jgi:anthranilate synthase component 1
MMETNDIDALAGRYPRVPVTLTVPVDTADPLSAFRRLKAVSRQCFILESLAGAGFTPAREDQARYTFIGYNPRVEITCRDGVLRMRGEAGTTTREGADPAAVISDLIEENRSPRIEGLPPFTGGLVGYWAWDYLKYSEPETLTQPPPQGEESASTPCGNEAAFDEEGFNDLDLMLFDRLAVYDHLRNELLLIASVKTDEWEENHRRALGELEYTRDLIATGEEAVISSLRLTGEMRALFSEAEYTAMVEKAKRYIYEGDIFQVVLANRLSATAEGSLFETYQALRTINPSPYMFYFSSPDIEIAGASPETLVKVKDGDLFTFPLAGTRPRGAAPDEDARLEAELLADPKELAEHNMLVDLGRNDIGRVSETGSVSVEKYLAVEKFSHVMHIGSTVRGRLRQGKTAIDALASVLRAGTLSGAPKIRACQIINELEGTKRGLYGGAIGYLDFSGNMDTCIGIRIAFKKNGKVFVRSGAGIVADSVAANEYHECENKMRAVLVAMQSVNGGKQ